MKKIDDIAMIFVRNLLEALGYVVMSSSSTICADSHNDKHTSLKLSLSIRKRQAHEVE